MNSARQKFQGLDGMRGVAAILVVVRHAPEYFGAQPFFRSHLAVDLFFVLSGFVIAHAYEPRFRRNLMTAVGFMTTRLIRLYPMYLLGLLMGVVWAFTRFSQGLAVYSVHPDDLQKILFFSLFFLPSHLDPSLSLFPLNSPAWSLFYELLTNIAYAIARSLLRFRVLLLLIGCSSLALLFMAKQVGTLDIGAQAGPKSMIGGSVRAIVGTAYGLLLLKLYEKGMRFSHAPRHPLLPLLVITLVFAVPRFHQFDWLFEVVAVLLVFPLCVIWSAGTSVTGGLSRTFEILGAISYPIYALHWPLVELGMTLFGEEIAAAKPLAGLVLLSGLVILCTITVRYVDEPIRHFLSRHVDQLRAGTSLR